MRTETTINDSHDFKIGKRLTNLPALREVGFTANRRLLGVQRLDHDPITGATALTILTDPVTTPNGTRIPGLSPDPPIGSEELIFGAHGGRLCRVPWRFSWPPCQGVPRGLGLRRFAGWGGQMVTRSGGPQIWVNSLLQACCQGQAFGRCSISRRAEVATRAGTAIRVRRIVPVVSVPV